MAGAPIRGMKIERMTFHPPCLFSEIWKNEAMGPPADKKTELFSRSYLGCLPERETGCSP